MNADPHFSIKLSSKRCKTDKGGRSCNQIERFHAIAINLDLVKVNPSNLLENIDFLVS